MNAAAFRRDLEAKPDALRRLAAALRDDDPWAALRAPVARVVAIGMGSSRFAALAASARLRARGIDAVAEYASATAAHPGGPGTLAVGISASGSTPETVAALTRHRAAGSTTVAVTNATDAELAHEARHVVDLAAGIEDGGVACRTFQHTLVLLLALEERLGGRVGAADLALRAADATDDLLDRREAWLDEVTALLTFAGQTFVIAPAERRSSSEQGALMLREGPRLTADACESGDWLHVDVYLTKPLDYRGLLFAGSAADAEVLRWATERGSTIVTVGGEADGARAAVRFRGDDDPDVALLTEILVPELVAATVWEAQEEQR